MFASIAGSQIISARITIPLFGIWEGDAVLNGETTVTGDVSTVIGNLTIAGHAFRAGAFVGRRKVRLVGGHGGWAHTVGPQAYYEPGGIPYSHVLGDVANACGETLSLAQDLRLWTRYVRESMQGARALNQILGSTWWIQNDGTTTNKPRATGAISSPFQVQSYDPGKGIFTIALDGTSIADWMPGNTFTAPTVDGTQNISSVTIVIEGASVRLEVMTHDVTSDLLSLVRETMPSLTFLGTYEYSARSDGGFDPIDKSLGLPSITNLELGLSLSTATLKANDSVRVRFVDGRPWRPELASAPASSTAITIGNASPAAIARVGDTIRLNDADIANIIAPSGGSGGACAINPGFHVNGTVTSGSGQVQSG